MSANLRVRVVLMAMGLAAVAGCLIESEDFAGQPCGRDLDCPESYRCAPRPTGRVCELIFPVERDSGVQDAGPPPPPRYYCSDVKPLLDFYCVDCHGPMRREGGDFRLDYYELDGGLPGARAMASNIKYRVALARTMPLPDASFFPSDMERAELFLWMDAGAPFCDAGVPAADGGSTDGGRDGGVGIIGGADAN